MNTRMFLMILSAIILFGACRESESKGMPELKNKEAEEVVDKDTPSTEEEEGEEEEEEEDDPQNTWEPPEGYGVKLPYFFTTIIVPDSMNLKEGGSSLQSRTNILHLQLFGHAYMQYQDRTADEFEVLAKKIGDLPREEGDGYLFYWGAPKITWSLGVEEISVKALTRYNDRYPEGADLANIVRLYYQSYDHVFEEPRPLKPYREKTYATDCANGFKPIKYLMPYMGVFREYLGSSRGYAYRNGSSIEIGFLGYRQRRARSS